jgi:hypothetical protein
MIRALLVLGITLAAASPARADLTHKIMSYTQGDAVPTSAVTTGTVPNFGSIVSTASGTAGDLAGTIASDGTMTITAGGANTLAIGQLTSELTIK